MRSNVLLSLNYNAKAVARGLTSCKCSVVNISGSRSVLRLTVRGHVRSKGSVLCLLRSVHRFRLCKAMETVIDVYSSIGCVARPRRLRRMFHLIGGCLSPGNIFLFSFGDMCGCGRIVKSAIVTRSENRYDFV